MPESSFARSALLFLIGAAAGAGSVWVSVSGSISSLEAERDELGRELRLAERKANEYEAYAEAERARIQPLQEELERMKTLRREKPLPAAASGGTPPSHGGGDTTGSGADPAPAVDPGTWDEPTYRRQLDRLAGDAAQARKAPGYPLVLEALRFRGEAGLVFLRSLLISGLGARHKIVAAMLLEDVGDAAAVPTLLYALDQQPARDDPLLANTLLNALAVLPGEEQSAALLDAWQAGGDDVNRRRAGLRGLARRAHPVARAVALGKVPGVGKVLRYVALGNLNIRERESGYQDAELRAVFEQSVASLDGSGQVDVVLEALAGYRSPTSVEPLRALAASDVGTPQQRTRARKLAEELAASPGAPDEPR